MSRPEKPGADRVDRRLAENKSGKAPRPLVVMRERGGRTLGAGVRRRRGSAEHYRPSVLPKERRSMPR